MAKLNWQRVSIQSKQQTYKETLPSNHHYINYDDNQLWSLHGKYHGIHLSKLPVNYLGWILDNSTSIKHKAIAETELRRRYNELTPTVSGPDLNTAVEKLG